MRRRALDLSYVKLASFVAGAVLGFLAGYFVKMLEQLGPLS